VSNLPWADGDRRWERPVTLAGALAVHNAEILHGLTLIYLLNLDSQSCIRAMPIP